MSTFDPQAFLDASIDTPLEKREPLPAGDYTALIGEVKSLGWQNADNTKSGIKWEFFLDVEVPPDVQDRCRLPASLKVRDSIMLDLTDGGNIDTAPGKNSRMRMYREAVDLNKPGDKFSARSLQGRVVLVSVKHDLYEGNIQEKVGRVTRR